MTSEMQREAIAALAEVWSLSPDVRLGQLLAHLGFLGEAHLGRGLGYIEDDELLAVLYTSQGGTDGAAGRRASTCIAEVRGRHISIRKSDVARRCSGR